MMPDLGKYAMWVLSAYGVSLSLLGALVVLSVAQARRTRAELARMEQGRAARQSGHNAPMPNSQGERPRPTVGEEQANG